MKKSYFSPGNCRGQVTAWYQHFKLVAENVHVPKLPTFRSVTTSLLKAAFKVKF
jgi:hypothetical protein